MTEDLRTVPAQGRLRRVPEAWLLATTLLASLLPALSLQLWRMDTAVPLYPDGDTPALLMLTRNIEGTGWFQTTSLLNAPFGQDLRAFPGMAGDTLHLLALKLLLLLGTNPVGALNTYYLLTFPLVAVSCHLALRKLIVTPAAATFASVLFAMAPYHFDQSQRHLFLAAYFMVPWACVVILRTLQGGLDYAPRSRVRSWATGGAFVLLLASTGIYYSAFFVLLMGFAVFLRQLDGGRLGEVATPILLMAGTVGIIGVEALPNLLHSTVGGGAELTGRVYAASEQYGLKIDHLFLPSPLHRVSTLGLPARRTFESPIAGERGDTLGLIGAGGVVVAMLAALSHHRRGGSRLVRDCGRLILVAILLGAIAGLGAGLSALGITYIRTWSRIAIYILFFALLAASTAWDHLRGRLAALGPRGRLYGRALVPALFILAVLDQTAPSYTPLYAANATAWHNDAAYFVAVEQAAGPRAAIFQLPYVEFPEGFAPGLQVSPYDGLLGYLHSDTLRWSFGGIRGENTQWQPEVLRGGLVAALPELRTVGFTAVQVDRLAYGDRGLAVERVLGAAASQPPVEDGTARWATYVIDRIAADLSRTPASVLNPVELLPSPGFQGLLGAEALLQTEAPETTFQVRNIGGQPRTIRLRGLAVLDLPGDMTLRTSAARLPTHRISPTRFSVDLVLTVPSGRTTIRVQITPTERGKAASPPDIALTFRNLHVEAV